MVLSSGNWSEAVQNSARPVLVDFWAPWCGPCRMIAPIVDELAGEYEGSLSIGKLNVDENQAIAAQFGVMSIPTLLIFKGGQPVERIVGFAPKKDLKAKIDAVL
ncbi:MAG TPA: thioredoxin [Symbiobacteriaceae bacterium]|nr:thioredoxin [Symbiobacteriaceae bacterium]